MNIIKKILYYLLVIILGIGITTIAGSISFNNLNKKLAKKEVEQENYSFVESLFNYVMCKDEDKFHSSKEENMFFEAYPCLVKQPYYKLNEEDKSIRLRYDTIEEAIGFSFFNLDSSFAYKDTKDTKGRLELYLDNGNKIDLFFDSYGLGENKINENIGFYDYVSHFASLNIYITYNDYITHGGALDVSVYKVMLFDGNNVMFLEKELNKKASFQTTMHEDYYEATQDYRNYVLEFGEVVNSVTTLERKQARLKKINQITNENSDKYIAKPSPLIVIFDTKFILTISITLALYMSLAIMITKLIFFRKH